MQTPSFTWPPEASLEALNARSRGTLMEALGIVFTELGDGYLRAIMPVAPQTRQPYGLLHGGASVALAETLGSSAGMLMAGGNAVVGLEINANHLRAVRSGTVIGTARPFHLGRSTQVWEIQIEDEGGQAVCISRITLAVLPAPPRG
ncbi:hotdog fold thioesterase [Thermomonas alba]|uniref:hotdog fold thioesterase n=1 Tax=Thermomonas alba TaxID=2888525 RepID=UPI001F033519|nr:hotdog fold thioesterase [Thermomonas alba]